MTTIDTIAGPATLARFPEATAQAASADLLVLTKTDLAPATPGLLAAARGAESDRARGRRCGDSMPPRLLFGGAPGRPAAAAARAPKRSMPTAFASLCLCLRRR